jgi:hypothetical protein
MSEYFKFIYEMSALDFLLAIIVPLVIAFRIGWELGRRLGDSR